MLYSYLSSFKALREDVKGKVFVEGEESGQAILLRAGGLVAGPLNPPLDYRYIKFSDAHAFGCNRLGDAWQPLHRLPEGLLVMMLLDPRTYLRLETEGLLAGDVFSQGPRTTALAGYDLQKALEVLGLSMDEASWVADVLGPRFETGFVFEDHQIEISLIDPLPGGGHVMARYPRE